MKHYLPLTKAWLEAKKKIILHTALFAWYDSVEIFWSIKSVAFHATISPENGSIL